jgi:DNA processing protein
MESDAHAEHIAMLALLQERPALAGQRRGDTSWPAISAEVSLRGSACALWQDLHPLTFDGMDFQPGLDRAHARLASWRDGDFRLITVLDDDYPMQLRTVHDMPPILFVKGHLHADDVGVSVVGARAASQRGRTMAAHIATGLAERGIMVISGLAAGIDTAAHHATLAAGGLPIGVIGTGISGVYPDNDASAQLHRQVATAGALVSQFWPDAPPHRHNFPLRNATMSGLGYASVIVEAGEHSGTRVQARAALAHGRPVILTDTVAAGTQWGQALTGRPGVYVASGTADVLGLVEELITAARNTDLVSLPGACDDAQ